MKKKIKAEAGDLFIVPIENDKYVVGLVGKISKKYFVGYFFDKVFPTNEPIDSELDFNNFQIVVYQLLSLSILTDGKWPIIKKNTFKEIVEAPMPKFKHYDSLRKQNYIVELDENLNDTKRYPSDISQEEWEKLPGAGLAGSIFMQKVLSNILLTKNQ